VIVFVAWNPGWLSYMETTWVSKDSICELLVRLDALFDVHGQATKHDGDKSAAQSAIRPGFGVGRVGAPSSAGTSYVVEIVTWEIIG